MNNKFDLFSGTRILEEVDSPVNGKVRVLQSLACGNHVQAGNLTQSGGVVTNVWKYSLKKVKEKKAEINNCLILGLGGGSAAKLVRNFWTNAEIIGVELDPVMVDLGMKYLGLGSANVKIITDDALEFCKKEMIKSEEGSNKKYDLILVDIYVGDVIPDKFETEDFVQNIKALISDNGMTVFNRIYFDENKGYAINFGK